MKIELKNVKHAAFASQETECFSATVFLDGVRTGMVENDGNGGSNMYHPWAMSETINDYAKTLPVIKFEGGILFQDADMLIGDVLNEYLSRKTLRRLLKNRILFTRGGKIYQTNSYTDVALRIKAADVLTKLKAELILNLLPEPEALKIYMENT
jgi:hypothetical protein